LIFGDHFGVFWTKIPFDFYLIHLIENDRFFDFYLIFI